MHARRMVQAALLSLLASGCVPNVDSGHVAVRFYPPPGKFPAVQQADEASCGRGASGYVRAYVECMQRRGYQPEIVGQGGIRMTVDQLPATPPGVGAAPVASVPFVGHPAPPSTHRASSCESQADQCQPCQNGRYRGTGFLCRYDSLSDCRSSILRFCKDNSSSGQALNVRGGHLTNDQVMELMMSCPNVPHGSIPYSGSPPAPGSKKAQQCEAFEKTYIACSFLSQAGPKRGACFRNTYSGP